MDAKKMVGKLAWAEVDAKIEPDCRSVLREERIALQAAIDSGDEAAVRSAAKETERVAAMWGVPL